MVFPNRRIRKWERKKVRETYWRAESNSEVVIRSPIQKVEIEIINDIWSIKNSLRSWSNMTELLTLSVGWRQLVRGVENSKAALESRLSLRSLALESENLRAVTLATLKKAVANVTSIRARRNVHVLEVDCRSSDKCRVRRRGTAWWRRTHQIRGGRSRHRIRGHRRWWRRSEEILSSRAFHSTREVKLCNIKIHRRAIRDEAIDLRERGGGRERKHLGRRKGLRTNIPNGQNEI